MLFRTLLACAICCIVVCSYSGTALAVDTCDSLSIKAAPNFPIGSKPYGMVAGDFDRDGNPDLAISSSEIQSISLLGGYGTGSLKQAVNFSAGNSPRDMRGEDFNGDTILDLVVVSGNNALIFLGMGNGSFSAGAALTAGTFLNLVTTGDFNGDGNADVAVTKASDPHAVIFFYGTGTGTFGPATTLPLNSNPFFITARDFNGDGKSELLILFPISSTNNAGIVFGTAGAPAPPVLIDVGDSPRVAIPGDFDNDGKVDLAISDVGFVSIVSGNGSGGFGLPRSFDSRIGVTAVADFNGDGRLDLAGLNTQLNVVGLMLNSSSGTFSPSREFFAGGTPLYLAVADYNHDGKPDLAAANSESEDISILFNDGSDGFMAAPSTHLGSGTTQTIGAGSPSSVTTVDLNADGRLDLAVSDYLLARVAVMLGNAGGGFDPPVYYRIEHEPIPEINYLGAQGGFVSGVAALDYDRDGKLDLITSNISGDNFSVIYGDGNGAFGLPYNFVGNFTPFSMRKADLNGDGISDLALAGRGPQGGFALGIMLGRAQGGFQQVSTLYAVGFSPKVEVADVTNDGKLDLISTADNFDRITILEGDGVGGVSAITTIPTTVHPYSVTPADLNGDGRQDLILVAYDPGKILIYLNGTSGLTLVNSYPAFIVPSISVAGDFNADGKIDIALMSGIPKTVRYYLGDGVGNFEFVGSYGSGADPRSAVAADFNGDGRADLAVANYASSSATILYSKACTPTDLSLSKTHSQNFAVGQNGVYSLGVNNTGLTSSSRQVRVIDNLPAGLTFVSATGSGWACSANGQTVTCDLGGRVLAGATNSIALTVAVGSSAFPSVTNTAVLDFPADSNTANNSASDPTQVGFTISGTVQNGASGVAGVTMTLSGDQSTTTVTSANGSYSFNVSNGSFTVTPSRDAFLFNPASRSFSNVTTNEIANFEALPQAPVLLTEANSSKAIALDSSTFLTGPFPALQNNYFIPDARTRVMIFATSLGLLPGEDASNVITGQAEDSLHRIYNLPVEAARPLPGFEWISQVNVKLTDEMVDAGDLLVSISIHGVTSNKVLLPMRPSFMGSPSPSKKRSK